MSKQRISQTLENERVAGLLMPTQAQYDAAEWNAGFAAKQDAARSEACNVAIKGLLARIASHYGRYEHEARFTLALAAIMSSYPKPAVYCIAIGDGDNGITAVTPGRQEELDELQRNLDDTHAAFLMGTGAW